MKSNKHKVTYRKISDKEIQNLLESPEKGPKSTMASQPRTDLHQPVNPRPDKRAAARVEDLEPRVKPVEPILNKRLGAMEASRVESLELGVKLEMVQNVNRMGHGEQLDNNIHEEEPMCGSIHELEDRDAIDHVIDDHDDCGSHEGDTEQVVVERKWREVSAKDDEVCKGEIEA